MGIAGIGLRPPAWTRLALGGELCQLPPPLATTPECLHLGKGIAEPAQPACRTLPGARRLRARQIRLLFFHESLSMSKGDLLEMEGVIQDALGGGQYNIRVDQGGAIVRAQLSGRMRRHHIRVLPGDRVRVAVSPYDLSHGLIVYRGK